MDCRNPTNTVLDNIGVFIITRHPSIRPKFSMSF